MDYFEVAKEITRRQYGLVRCQVCQAPLTKFEIVFGQPACEPCFEMIQSDHERSNHE